MNVNKLAAMDAAETIRKSTDALARVQKEALARQSDLAGRLIRIAAMEKVGNPESTTGRSLDIYA